MGGPGRSAGKAEGCEGWRAGESDPLSGGMGGPGRPGSGPWHDLSKLRGFTRPLSLPCPDYAAGLSFRRTGLASQGGLAGEGLLSCMEHAVQGLVRPEVQAVAGHVRHETFSLAI